MNLDETYKKIPWLYKMPNIFTDEGVSIKRLDTLEKDDQAMLIFEVINSLGRYFGKMPGNPENMSIQDLEKSKENLGNMLEIWLSGLCDLNVSQIINGLLDILNLKTEYQKWPPNSVMEFYSICRKPKVPYHSEVKFKKIENFKKIGFDEEGFKKRKFENQVKTSNYIYKMLGRSYKGFLQERIKKLENKTRSEQENKTYKSYKEAMIYLETVEAGKKEANI
jgi:hypothetical protein